MVDVCVLSDGMLELKSIQIKLLIFSVVKFIVC